MSAADTAGSGVRVRFAPSPTGYLHVGSARTALFNWLHARAVGGTFVLRIEDTDGDRNRPELIENILEELEWLGIDYDEGPLYQSERAGEHKAAVLKMLADGSAYCVDGDNNEVQPAELADGEIPEGIAVRYRMPKGRTLSFDDMVRGNVTFSTDDLEDFVIWRSNGSAVFLLANAVDDAGMGITHAIRGEDLLNTVPKVVLLLEAIGAPQPVYAHLPLLVNEQRKKLSKRRDDVSIADYRAKGYLPEAMRNHMALLGWGPRDDIEIRPIEEIISAFAITDVNKAPAFFDLKKLDHINATYIQAMSPAEFVAAAEPFIDTADEAGEFPWTAEAYDRDTFEAVAADVQQRAKTLGDVAPWIDWLFVDEVTFEEKAWNKGIVKAKRVDEILRGVADRFADCEWDAESIEGVVRSVGDELEVRSQVPVRVAVTGKQAGIPLWDGLVRLGRDRAIARLETALGRLGD